MPENKNASTLTADQLKARENREAQRGRFRNKKGKIVFTKEQLQERKFHFEEKLKGYEKRLKNIKVELEQIEGLLKSK